jgi:hypothetical protein
MAKPRLKIALEPMSLDDTLKALRAIKSAVDIDYDVEIEASIKQGESK